MLDHLHNSQSVVLDDLEILVGKGRDGFIFMCIYVCAYSCIRTCIYYVGVNIYRFPPPRPPPQTPTKKLNQVMDEVDQLLTNQPHITSTHHPTNQSNPITDFQP